MIFPWSNSASDMFASLSIPSFDELLRILYLDFGQGLLFQITTMTMTMTMTMKISLFDINHLNTMIRENEAEK